MGSIWLKVEAIQQEHGTRTLCKVIEVGQPVTAPFEVGQKVVVPSDKLPGAAKNTQGAQARVQWEFVALA